MPQSRSRSIDPLFFQPERQLKVGCQRHGPAGLPPGKTQYPVYKSLSGPHSRSGWVRKISSQLVFKPRTVQRVGSRCTKYGIPAHMHDYTMRKPPIQ
jgi:hypothetical protein